MSEKRMGEELQDSSPNKRNKESDVPWQEDMDTDFLEDQTDSDIKEQVLNVYNKMFAGGEDGNPFHVATKVMSCTHLTELKKETMTQRAKEVKIKVLSLYLEYQRRKTVVNSYTDE